MRPPVTMSLGAFLSVCVCVSLQVWPASATPQANDMFANRVPVTGLPLRLAGNATEATVEPGEPTEVQPGFGRRFERSVWWSWTAPKSGLMGAYFGVNRRQDWRVYVGERWEELVAVPLVLSPDGTIPSRNIPVLTDWSFRAEAGTTYQIAIYDGEAFTLDLMERPSNDFFADRLALPADGGVLFGTTSNATFESGEPITTSKDIW